MTALKTILALFIVMITGLTPVFLFAVGSVLPTRIQEPLIWVVTWALNQLGIIDAD